MHYAAFSQSENRQLRLRHANCTKRQGFPVNGLEFAIEQARGITMPSDIHLFMQGAAHQAAIRAHKLKTLGAEAAGNDNAASKFGAVLDAAKISQQPANLQATNADTLNQEEQNTSSNTPQTAGKDLIDFVTHPPLFVKIGLALLRPTPLGIAGTVASHFIGKALFPEQKDQQTLDQH